MLFNYLKLSLRLLIRNPFFTFINIAGLAVGFAAFFILWQHATSELKTDQYHKDFERIVRVGMTFEWSDDGITWGRFTSGALKFHYGPMIADEFPQVETYTRVLQQPQFDENLVGHSNQVIISLNRNGTKELFEEDRVVYADPNLFEFFTIPLLHGGPATVLEKVRSVVLSATKAKQYFGKKNPVGETLMVNDTILLTVTGVFEDLPKATHLAFDMVISNAGLTVIWQEVEYTKTSCYFKIDSKEHVLGFEKGINQNVDKYVANDLKRANRLKLKFHLFVQPLNDIAFTVPYMSDYRPEPKSKSILILLQVVSVLVLLMSWVNYINLCVSRMMKRMKEVATRKMSGALSFDFAKQFLVESSVTNVLAVALAFTTVQLVRIPVMIFFEIHIPEFSSISSVTWGVFGLTITLGILITGLFPAVMSASYSPRTLFAVSKMGPARRLIQSLLTVGQYSTAFALILWSFIVYFQLNYILNKDLGIRREQVVIVEAPVSRSSSYLTDFDFFLEKVRSIHGVQAATSSISVVGDLTIPVIPINRTSQSTSIGGIPTNGGVDEDFIPFYGIPILAGRNFKPRDQGDVVIVSRYATKRLGFDNPEDAVGANVFTYTNPLTIVGVIEDYRLRSLVNVGATSTESSTGGGICLAYKNKLVSWYHPRKMSVRIEMNRLDATLAEIQKNYQSVFPGNFFKWYFLDDHINEAYNNDKITRNQIALFTFLAIGISCLGLLGMMTLFAEEKTKEIGIRKVLGAGVKEIGAELMKNVSRQVILSIVIALPASYYLANQYLERYLEKISLQWWHFALPVVVLMIILFVTITSVLWKAARANPVEALKYE